MITDLAEIRRLGIAKQVENLRFRRYLAAHHQRIEAFQKLAVEMQRQMDCTACANCCRYSIVNLDEHETAAIARHLGLPPAEVVRLYTEPDPESPRLRAVRSNQRRLCIYGWQSLHDIRSSPHSLPRLSARQTGNAFFGRAGSRHSAAGHPCALCCTTH